MKLTALPASAIVLVCMALPCQSQVFISINTEHSSYLRYEGIPARLVVENRTNRLLTFGTNDISVIMEDGSGHEISMRDGQHVCDGLVIPAEETVEIDVNLGSLFVMQEPGKYFARGSVTVGGKKFASSRMSVDVVTGLKICSENMTVTDDINAVRTYTLRSWDRQSIQHLFLQVLDQDNSVCYGVFDLGPFIRMVDPEVVVEASGRIRVKRQTERDSFVVSEFISTSAGVRPVTNEVQQLQPPPHMRKLR